jgi:hypothetical protein
MLTTLQTAYTDTRAGDLAWCLGKDALPALAVLDRGLDATDGVEVQMRLLGASHQVILDSPRGRCSETVACMKGSTTPLPFGVAKRVAGWDYEFAARIETRPGAPSPDAPRNCWRWSPITRTGWRERFRAIRTRSPRCSSNTATAASIGALGTPIRRKTASWRLARGSAHFHAVSRAVP